MIAKSVGKYIDCSPQKTRLVADMVRGRSVGEALTILRFTKKRVARDLVKVLRSAVANAESAPSLRVDVDDLFVSSICVDGASLKFRRRMLPAPMGRAYRFVRRQCHVTIGLDERKKKG